MSHPITPRTLLAPLGVVALLLSACGRSPAPAPPEPPTPAADGRRRVVILGDSLTAGHTLSREEAFPAHLQALVDAEGWPFVVVNAGVNGDTTTDGLQRLAWVLREPADVLVLELGGNDGLRGIPVDVTHTNLRAMIDRARELHPHMEVILAGMKLPPNYGADYVAAFERIYPELAAETRVRRIPFLLEDVAAVPELNLPDGIHPTAEGHRRVADTVWQTLRPVLAERLATPPTSPM